MSETLNEVMVRLYADSDLKIFFCWWTVDGRCACPSGASCKSPGKHPLLPPAHAQDSPERATCKGECGRPGHGLYDATTDLDVLLPILDRYPLAHPGMPADGNGLAILDVDVRKDGDASEARLRAYLDRKREPFPKTLTQFSGSRPPGRHYLFNAPPGGVGGKANAFGPDMPGLDVRGRGHYIVVAPSGHASGGQYEWDSFGADVAPWPDIFTRLINPPRPAPAPRQRDRPVIADRYAAAALEKEITAVRSTQEGGRNDRLNEASFALGQFVGAGLLDEMMVRRELYQAAVAAGLGEREAASTILSGLGGGKAKPRAGMPA